MYTVNYYYYYCCYCCAIISDVRERRRFGFFRMYTYRVFYVIYIIMCVLHYCIFNYIYIIIGTLFVYCSYVHHLVPPAVCFRVRSQYDPHAGPPLFTRVGGGVKTSSQQITRRLRESEQSAGVLDGRLYFGKYDHRQHLHHNIHNNIRN